MNTDQYAPDLLAHLNAWAQAPTHDAACHLELQLQPAPLQLQAPVAAIPEPASWAMLLAGLAVLGWVARRRVF